jgi:hypothetical protein
MAVETTAISGVDPRLQQTSPSLLPKFGLIDTLPADLRTYDAYGNPLPDLRRLRPVGSS